MKIVIFVLSFLTLCGCKSDIQKSPINADVVIYGGTSAAVIAAVQLKKMNKSVVIVCPDKHLGGLSSSGLGWTDSGNKKVIGGLSREFYHRLWKKYNKKEYWKWQTRAEYPHGRARNSIDDKTQTIWTFEPHVAEEGFEDLIKEYDIAVYRDEWLDRKDGVLKSDGKITAIKMLSGKIFKAKIFIDTTYEGDLMATAGVSYIVGREANSQYNETLNGNQIASEKHQFKGIVDPFIVPGKPESGLLPRISKEGPGKLGFGDNKVQAYNYRMCMTNVPENRVPFPKPEGYDVKQYELLLRTLKAGSRHVYGKFDPIPNRKTDTNNHGSFSTDNIGMSDEYPDASYEKRRVILKEHETYQKGYFYFLANDPRVPEDIRMHYNTWGLAKDEFTDNGHWPHQIYVRVARRMIGHHVLNQNHLQGKIPVPQPVGMGSYNMDSHNVRRYAVKDKVSGTWTTVHVPDTLSFTA